MRRGRAQTRRALGARAALGAAAAAIAFAGALDLTGAVTPLERASVTARFHVRGATPPRDVVVVGIDAQSFNELHARWPFPRRLHAAVIDRLRAAHPRAIVYDVQFTEPTTARDDGALYDALGRTPGVILATTSIGDHGRTNVLGGEASLALVHAEAAASVLPVDDGGQIARFPHAVGGLDSVAVVAARHLHGHRAAAALPRPAALIDYAGPPGTVRAVSFGDVKEGRVSVDALRDKIVVVGATDPALQDLHSTPAGGGLMSGPEIQANAIASALRGAPLRPLPPPVDLLLVVLLAALPLLLRLRTRSLHAGLASAACAAGYLGAAQLAFDRGLVLGVAAPLAALITGVVAMIAASHAAEVVHRRRLAAANERLNRELYEAEFELVSRLAQAAESRDEDTGEHIDRMAALCERLARAAGMSARDAALLRHAAPLHDVGKIAIPDRILLKPGPLDAEERREMQTHTLAGAEVLEGSHFPLVQMARTIALTHHERWDGTGYPHGLRGEQIPFVGRVAAVCDVFDALTSVRPYKDAWPVEDALEEIRAQAGRQFDPELALLFVKLQRETGAGDEAPARVMPRAA